MKKFILTIVALLSIICLTFGIAGCNAFPAPNAMSEAAGFVSYNNFDDFKKFYNRKFVKSNKERMYLLAPGKNIIDYEYYAYVDFAIVGDGLVDYSFTNPIVEENFSIYDEALGDSSGQIIVEGSYSCSFRVSAEFYPVHKKIKPAKLNYDFDNSNVHYISVKIKNGEELIGLCKFNTELDISKEWFEEYLKNNLI